MSKHYLVLISGGPGLFDPKDKEHDLGWANYVTPPLLLAKKSDFVKPDEKVVWYVYEPAYVARWDDDVNNPHQQKRMKEEVERIHGRGAASYANYINQQANAKGWSFDWLKSANDLWGKLKLLQLPISRTIYWGHANPDLWLSLRPGANPPDSSAIFKVGDVNTHQKDLKGKFLPKDRLRVHRFVGCNTKFYAQAWANAFGVFADGTDGKVNFDAVLTPNSSGDPELSPGASWVHFSPPN